MPNTDTFDIQTEEIVITSDVFNGKIKDIEGVLNKLSEMIDVKQYKEELEEIISESDRDPEVKALSRYDRNDIRRDRFFQDGIYGKYARRLDRLNEILSAYNPFYDLYSLYNTINRDINHDLENTNSDNVDNVIKNTKTLFDILIEIGDSQDKEKKEIIKKGYETLYRAILYERVFAIDTIYKYVMNKIAKGFVRENLGRLLFNDIKTYLKEDELHRLNVNTLNEDLNYDYLNDEIITLISSKKMGMQNPQYIEKRNDEINQYVAQRDIINSKVQIQNKRIKNSMISSFVAFSLLASIGISSLSFILFPVAGFKLGKKRGYEKSQKITEYGIITRTINPNTSKVIDGPSIIYEEQTTSYTATIYVYSPWKKSPSNTGYISTVTAYEYVATDNSNEGFEGALNSLESGTFKTKYSFLKSKDKLDADDSTTEATIQITETFWSPELKRPSNKYTTSFAIGGAFIGVFIDAIILWFCNRKKKNIRQFIESLKQKIKDNNMTVLEANQLLDNLSNDELKLKSNKKGLYSKYGKNTVKKLVRDRKHN